MSEKMEVKMPPALKDENKLNVILLGPTCCGKTVAANYMAQEHQRVIVRMDQLVDYWQKRNHPLAQEAADYLLQKEEEYKVAVAELEKSLKAKKPKKGEVIPEINKEEYNKLPREMHLRMLQKRMLEEDCNAGAIFDNLKSELWSDEKYAIELICDTLSIQNIQVMIQNGTTKYLIFNRL